jgi:hypothetical protein
MDLAMLTVYDLTEFPDEALAGCDGLFSKPIVYGTMLVSVSVPIVWIV